MRKITLVSLALVLLTGTAFASIADFKIADGEYPQSVYGAPLNSARADTFYLLGGPDRNDGKFQDDLSGAIPDWEGWESVDGTALTAKWHISTYRTGVNAAYCGDETIPSCGPGDPVGGYGNSWNEWLDWYGTVANPASPVTVDVTGTIWYDNEDGYDYTIFYLEEGADNWNYHAYWNGRSDDLGEAVAISMTVDPAMYVGPSNDQVHIRFRAMSDGAWSDSDCDWPTEGHTSLDDLAVAFDGVQITFDDFEAGLGNWEVVVPASFGDFGYVWPRLGDIDPCRDNNSPQVAWIDDGVVNPCTEGSPGITWTYGPGGFVVNSTGGCAGDDSNIMNHILSPVLEYVDPADGVTPLVGCDGATYGFNVYRHQLLSNYTFYTYRIRSRAAGVWSGWINEGYIYYGGPDYIRQVKDVTDMLQPGRDAVQLRVEIYDLDGASTDYTPAPYFDNISFKCYEFGGPAITTRQLELAQDNFPTIGDLDFTNLGMNDVAFDMANDVIGNDELNTPGDSVVFDIVPVRTGTVMADRPILNWALDANPLFDAYRASADLTGQVIGDSIWLDSGALYPDRWSFDLPDEDFLYPGDIIHYYIEATDDGGGTSYLPSNLDGFGVFPGDAGYQPLLWSSNYTVHALPTIFDAQGDQAPILFWNDFGDRGGENEWLFALNALGYQQGVDFDMYYTNAPSTNAVGNGLGGRATQLQIAGYETLLYSSGDLLNYTLCNGDYETDNVGDDVGLLDAWLQTGKNALFTGDEIVNYLMQSGANGVNFVTNWFSVDFNGDDLRPFIGGQATPLVLPIAGNTVGLTTEFVAFGGCPGFNTFDMVTPSGSCERIAEFADAAGNGGVYDYAAGILNQNMGSNVVYFPFDFMYWYDSGRPDAPLQARAEALNEILLFFGHLGTSTPTNVVPGVFAARNYPNPFNPNTKIEWSIPQAGDLSIKVFNVRGELVKTLVDGVVTETSGIEIWNGKSDDNSDVASGIYFYEVRSGDNVKVNKMALVK